MDNSGYDFNDPKNPDHYERLVDIWDNRDKFCDHGYDKECPDCDSPEYLPTVLDEEGDK